MDNAQNSVNLPSGIISLPSLSALETDDKFYLCNTQKFPGYLQHFMMYNSQVSRRYNPLCLSPVPLPALTGMELCNIQIFPGYVYPKHSMMYNLQVSKRYNPLSVSPVPLPAPTGMELCNT